MAAFVALGLLRGTASKVLFVEEAEARDADRVGVGPKAVVKGDDVV